MESAPLLLPVTPLLPSHAFEGLDPLLSVPKSLPLWAERQAYEQQNDFLFCRRYRVRLYPSSDSIGLPGCTICMFFYYYYYYYGCL